MKAALLRFLRVAAVGAALVLSWMAAGAWYVSAVDDVAGTYLTVFGAAAAVVYLPLYALADALRLPAAASGRTQGMAILYGWLLGLPASFAIIFALVGLTWVMRS